MSARECKASLLPVFRMGRVELVFDSGENGSVLFNLPVKPRIGNKLIPWKHLPSAIGKLHSEVAQPVSRAHDSAKTQSHRLAQRLKIGRRNAPSIWLSLVGKPPVSHLFRTWAFFLRVRSDRLEKGEDDADLTTAGS